MSSNSLETKDLESTSTGIISKATTFITSKKGMYLVAAIVLLGAIYYYTQNTKKTNTEQVQEQQGQEQQGQYQPPPGYVTATNTYNGSAFTSSTAINTARGEGVGAGTTSAGVITGGNTGSVSALTEQWDGSSWTEVGDLNTARNLLAGSGSSSSAMIAFGGDAPARAITESWNGTSWTELGDLSTGRRELGGSSNGTNLTGLAFSGCIANGTVQTSTEEWDFAHALKTIDVT